MAVNAEITARTFQRIPVASILCAEDVKQPVLVLHN